MQKEGLINNFCIAQALDTEVTLVAMRFLDHQEVNPLAANLFDTIGTEGVLAAKAALTAAFIGGYLLSKRGSGRLRLDYVMEKSLKLGNYLYAAIGILNVAELAVVFLQKS